jgi:hypothetical protein
MPEDEEQNLPNGKPKPKNQSKPSKKEPKILPGQTTLNFMSKPK